MLKMMTLQMTILITILLGTIFSEKNGFEDPEGQQVLQCNDTASGLTWTGISSCDNALIYGGLKPEFSKLSFLEEIRFRLEGGTIPIEYSVLDVKELVNFRAEAMIPIQFSTWSNIEKLYLGRTFALFRDGRLHPEFSEWRKLKELTISNVRIQGNLPVQLSTWKKIEKIQLTNNVYSFARIGGILPAAFSEWKELHELSIVGHYIEGNFPEQVSTWSNIEKVKLHYPRKNSRYNNLPAQISEWRKLKEISIKNQRILESLPVQISTWQNIQVLEIGPGCDVMGTIPSQFSLWNKLENLNLADNLLSGMLPEQFSTWSKIQQINIENNLLFGGIPVEYTAWQQLSSLSLTNQFQGELCILKQFMNFLNSTRVQSDVDKLQVCNSRPEEIDALFVFKNSLPDPLILDSWVGTEPCFWQNVVCINGFIRKISFDSAPIQIPQQFSALQHLTNITFQSAIGTIPVELSVLDVKHLDLNNHEMQFARLPSEFSTWSNIIFLNLSSFNNSSGKFTGVLPEEYSTWEKIAKIDLGNNFFSGTFPVQFSTWTKIEKIDLGNNLFSGTLPVQLSTWGTWNQSCAFCIYVRFSNNRFSGTIPDQYRGRSDNSDTGTVLFSPQLNNQLCISTYLAHFFVRDYRVTDVEELPNCMKFEFNEEKEREALLAFRDTINVTTFFSFSTRIRTWYRGSTCTWGGIECYNGSVVSITLFSSDFVASIPPQFSNLKNLYQIKLLENFIIRGPIPVELSSLNLYEFGMQSSFLSSSLPQEFSTWSNLRNFNLRSVQVLGRLHEQYSAWRMLEHFNITNSTFSGALSPQFSEWQFLRKFLVKNNSFTGTLPREYSTWQNLVEFSASQNNFSGTMPIEYTNLILQNALRIVPQKNREFIFFPNSNDTTNFCFSLQLQVFLAQLVVENNFQNTPISNCEKVLQEMEAALNMHFRASQHALINQDRSNCNFSNNCFETFEHQFSNGRKVPVLVSRDLQINIKKLLERNFDARDSIPFFVVEQEKILKTLLDFKKQVNQSFELNFDISQLDDDDDDDVRFSIREDPCRVRYIRCDQEKRIVEIQTGTFRFSPLQIPISIPPEFSNLKNLKKIEIERPFSVVGTIPPELSVLELMQEFKVEDEIRGSLPPQISTWKFLSDFCIQGELTGTLPVQLSTWKLLQSLHILPSELSSRQYKESFLKGNLPSQYSTWKNLKEIEIFKNSLSGNLPNEYSTWGNGEIMTILLNDNRLNGTLPCEFSVWSNHNISTLDLSSNFLSGTLPSEYSKLNIVQEINLSGNRFSGTLPSEYSVWRTERAINLSNNLLSGTLPEQFSQWAESPQSYWDLKVDVSRNFLTGSVPHEFSIFQIARIDVFLMQYLGGLCVSKSIQTIFLKNKYNNDIMRLPVCNQDEISIVEAEALLAFQKESQNQNQFESWKGLNPCAFWAGIECLNGRVTSFHFTPQIPAQTSLPPEFSKLEKLQRIDLHDQLITGTIPAELSILTDMQYLNLENHELSGTLPPELSMQSNLKQFLSGVTFSDGLLTGPLPEQYSTWQVLYRVELFENELTGTLPVQFSEWSCGFVLMSNNSFSGAVPVEYSKWKKMELMLGEENKDQMQLDLQNNNQLCISQSTFDYLENFQAGLQNLPKCIDITRIEYPTDQMRLLQTKLVKKVLNQDDWGQGEDVCNNWTYVGCYNGFVTSLSGPTVYVPPEISILKNLTSLEMQILTGTLPPEISILDSLENFVLDVFPQLSLQLPVQYSALSSIRYFRVLGGASGEIPAQYSVWTDLRVFQVSGANLSKEVPIEYSAWGYKLVKFDVKGAQLPDQFSVWRNLDS